MASSGHIAGIINPPGGTGTYWINEFRQVRPRPRRNGAKAPPPMTEAGGRTGRAWLAKHSGRKVKPPKMGSENYPIIEDAPGSYVLEK